MNYTESKPVVLVAFTPLETTTNATWNLAALQQAEKESIQQAFHPEVVNDEIEFVFIENVERNDLRKQLKRYSDRIILFHYNGLSETDGFDNGDYIFRVLGRLPNLKLIYLHSYKINHLTIDALNQGIQSVIAINSANNEDLTSKFTEQFYINLSTGKTLKASFEAANEYIALVHDSRFRFEIHTEISEKSQKSTRALHLNRGAASLLDWKLPIVAESTDSFQPFIPKDFQPNDFIAEILKELATQKSTLYKFYRNESFEKQERLNLVAEQFPSVIGLQLQRLTTYDDKLNNFTFARLEQIASTYSVIGQFLYYVILAQLWKMKKENQSPFRRGQFRIKEDVNIDYFEAIEPLLNGEAGISLFLPELTDLGSNIKVDIKKEQAFLYFQELNVIIKEGETYFSKIEEECAKAEHALATVLKEVAFLINYHYVYTEEVLVAGKPQGIDYLIKYKTGTISNHKISTLTANVALPPKHFIILKDLKNLDNHLNLTPFIINGFFSEEENNKTISTYLCLLQEEDVFYYLNCKDSWHNVYENSTIKEVAIRRRKSVTSDPFDTKEMALDELRVYLEHLALDL